MKPPAFTWTILKHPGTYIGTIGMTFALCIGYIALKDSDSGLPSFKCQPYSPASLKQAIVDDDVEVAPIYRKWRHS